MPTRIHGPVSKRFPAIESAHRATIAAARIFFTASAAQSSYVNVSPRPTDALRVIDAKTVAYLDRTGSGNETAAHVRAGGRLTMMFCSFEGPPSILRLYGRGRVLARSGGAYATMLATAFDGIEPPGARQIVVLDVELVQTSCGFGVPLFDYRGERTTLTRWAQSRGEAALEAYRCEKNAHSLDGLPTGLGEAASPGQASVTQAPASVAPARRARRRLRAFASVRGCFGPVAGQGPDIVRTYHFTSKVTSPPC